MISGDMIFPWNMHNVADPFDRNYPMRETILTVLRMKEIGAPAPCFIDEIDK
jgi:hypothetical protein